MEESKVKKVVRKILESSDLQINGDRPWDIRIHNPNFYERILSGGSLALGESYMDGWWDCEALDQFFERILENRLDRGVKVNSLQFLWVKLKPKGLSIVKRKIRSHCFDRYVRTCGVQKLQNFYESCPPMFKSRWPLFVAYDSWKCFCEFNKSVD
jgi:hypothetical protein